MATTITKEQIQEAGRGATTISQVARVLGLCGTKLSGSTARKIRDICNGLDDILKANRAEAGASTESTAPESGKVSPDAVPDPDNPYRLGSTYAKIFEEGCARYWTKQELIEKVAAQTGKSAKCIAFSLSVLSHKAHSSNQNRSTALREDGRIKLIAIRRH